MAIKMERDSLAYYTIGTATDLLLGQPTEFKIKSVQE